MKESKINKEINVAIKSEEQYLAILNSLTDPMHIIDKDYNIQFLNSAMVLWLNKLKLISDLVGKTLFEAFPFLEYDKIHNEYNNVFKTGEILNTIEATKLPNGIIFTETLKIPVKSNGKVEQVITLMRDITEQKEAEERLKASEEKYKNIINNLMDIIIILDLKGNFLYVSPQIYDISGFKQKEISGKNGFKLMHPDDINKAASVLKEAIEQKKRIYIEYRTIHKQGHYIDVSASGRIVNIEGEDRIFAVVRDISEHKIYEQKLKESEEKYRGLVNNITDIIFELGINGKCTYVSNQLFEISGFHPEEMIGQKVFQYLHPEDFLNVTEKVKEAFQKGIRISIDFRIRHKDGFYVPVSSNFNVIRINGEQKFIGVLRDNTEKRKTEQELLNEKEFTVTALNTQRDTFFVFEASTGEAIRWNRAFKEISGYSNEEISRMRAPDSYYNEDDLKRAALATEEISTEGEALFEMKLITKNGNEIPFEYIGSNIKDEQGNLKYIVSIGRDITEGKKAEYEIKKSNEFLNSFIENAQGPVYVKDLNGIYQLVNKYYESLFGLDKAEILGGTDYDTHPNNSEIAEKLRANDKIIIDANEVHIFEEIIVAKGKKRKFHSVKFPLYDDKGKISSIGGIAIDITELKETEVKLRESEENFRNIAEQSFMGIEIIQDGKIKYVNEAASKILEFSVQEMKAWEYEELFKFVYPEDLPVIYEQQKIRQEGKISHIRYSVRSITKSGKIKWLEISSKTVLYQGKEAIFAIFYDVSERKEAEQELIKLNQLKSELLRRTSHELKTPLVSIKGFSELLLQVHRDKLDDLVISTLNEIKQGCLRLETLIGDILKTAELESGTIQLHKSEEDLSFLVRVCVNEIRGFSKLRNHTINLELQEKLIIQFEKEQIHQVIGNLLNNAVKYTPPSGIIEIKSDIQDDVIIVSIRDNGIGFTEEEKTRIFKQFGKIERYGQGMDIIAEGSGFGLFISKKIIELHGGDIWVESEGRNMGSTFYFSLPII